MKKIIYLLLILMIYNSNAHSMINNEDVEESNKNTNSKSAASCDLKSSLNPYQMELFNDIAKSGNRKLQEEILPAINAHFESLGQHGSLRHKNSIANATRDMNEEIARKQQIFLQSCLGRQKHHR